MNRVRRGATVTSLIAGWLVASLFAATWSTATSTTWTARSPLPEARYALAAATGSDGTIYAIGGELGGPRDTVVAYDPPSDTWTTVAPMPMARFCLAAAAGPDGRIYAIGGTTNGFNSVNTVEAFNPSTDTWTTVAAMPTARACLTATTGLDGKIYAIGGTTNGSNSVNTVEAFDPSTDTWTTVASMTTARFGPAAATGLDGTIYASGGYDAASGGRLDSVEAYDPVSNSWMTVAPMPTAHGNHGAATGSDGTVYVIGGNDQFSNTIDTVHAYEPSTNQWTTVDPMLSARFGLAAAAGSDGTIYAIGGYDPDHGGYTTAVEAYGASVPPTLAITDVTDVSGPVSRYERFEAEIELSREFSNPFDPNEVVVDVDITSPSDVAVTVPAFWYEGFTPRIDSGLEQYDPIDNSAAWRVRFAPTEVGTYRYVVTATAGTDSASSNVRTFEVSESDRSGFLRIDEIDPHALRFDDGRPYIPIGHNAGWDPGSGTAYFEQLFDSFGRADENWSRIWMTDFNRSALEWSSGHWSGLYDGVGTYSLESAWRMDQILDDAERNGVMVQMVLNDHGQFNANDRWSENPYNEANGGPIPSSRPDGFFTDPQARDFFEARVRYIVARWGAYTNILAWELFNEVQFIGSNEHNPFNDPVVWQDVLDWHADVASYLDSLDPHDHLITSSSDPAPAGADLGSVAGIDLVQIHDYRQPPSSRGQMFLDLIAQLQVAHQKPVIVGEFGIGGDPPPEAGFDPENCSLGQADCEHLLQGTHVHNAVWTAAMARSGAMSWWWDNYIEADPSRNREAPHFPLNERVFPPLVAFLHGEDLAAGGYVQADIEADATVFAAGLDNGERALVWVRDAENEFGTGARPGDLVGRSISGASVTLNGLPPAAYRVTLFDPYATDGPFASIGLVAPGAPVVALPEFQRDIAFKIEPNGLPTGAALAQFEANGTTSIPIGSTTDGATVVLKGSVSDPDGDRVRLEVEVKRLGVPFDGSGTIQGALVSSAATASVTVPALPRAVGYHWRARALDELGAASAWMAFGGNPETDKDFAVEAPIVFSSGNGQAQDVWIMNPDGTGLVRLTTNPGFDGEPALSPDGSKIAYSSAPTSSGARDIWVMNVDGSGKSRLTTNAGADERPTWSGDGSRIAFTSVRTDVSPTSDIWTMRSDGTDQIRLTTTNGLDGAPNWSRDGTRIAFVSVRDGNEEIFVMNANGSGQTQLTFTSGNVRNGAPTWSNDGLRIAFSSNRTKNNFEIYSVVVAAPSTITRLTTRSQSDVAPSWSRDGMRIVFASGNPNGTGYDIWRMFANGSGQARLTTMAPNDAAPNW